MECLGDSRGVQELPELIGMVCVGKPCFACEAARVHAYHKEDQVVGKTISKKGFFLCTLHRGFFCSLCQGTSMAPTL